MITFRNDHPINFVQAFIERFELQINELTQELSITILYINEQDSRYGYITSNSEPFATNPLFTNPFIVAINEALCEHLSLSQEEKFAMIAHEIGHILDETPREANNQLIREINADQFAINLGLSNELRSGLEKFIQSGNYTDVANDLNARINRLA